MAKKPTSARAARREQMRQSAKLARDVERLFLLSPGGSPERPIELESASQVEVHASSMACPLCHGPLRVEEHVAETFGPARLRVARVVCTRCGVRRAIHCASVDRCRADLRRGA